MAKGTTHTVTLPNGSQATRTSKTRVYTHAVVTNDRVWSWCGRRDLAEKELAKWRSWCPAQGDLQVVEVTR